jgi:hypothetical protein
MAQRDYEVVLSPALEISPDEFAAAWNELAESRDIGEARVVKTRGAQFDVSLIATILISIGTGAASNLISELIMKVLEKRGSNGKRTHIERVKKPDGTETFMADIDE